MFHHCKFSQGRVTCINEKCFQSLHCWAVVRTQHKSEIWQGSQVWNSQEHIYNLLTWNSNQVGKYLVNLGGPVCDRSQLHWRRFMVLFIRFFSWLLELHSVEWNFSVIWNCSSSKWTVNPELLELGILWLLLFSNLFKISKQLLTEGCEGLFLNLILDIEAGLSLLRNKSEFKLYRCTVFSLKKNQNIFQMLLPIDFCSTFLKL